ncbi:MAG: TRAP transporter TatT component family protein [Planctomycetota bacterium]
MWIATLLACPLSGCALDKVAADNMAPVLRRTADEFNRVPIDRAAREAGPGLLATLEGIVATSPENPELRLLQAELNASFAFAFLDSVDAEWAAYHYRVGQVAALRALDDEDEELSALVADSNAQDLRAALEDYDDEDALPALFWWAFARGAEINLHRDDPGEIAKLERVDAVMGWVLERDPGFFNGGPHLYMGIRKGLLPKSLGGDPEEAVAHFERVDALTGGKHLLAKVLRAEFCAPHLAATESGASVEQILAAQQQAWDAFYGALKAVIEAPADLWPEQALTNAVAKTRARRLLSDPEAYNIIVPQGAQNEFAPAEEGWDDEGWEEGSDDDWDDSEDGDTSTDEGSGDE